LKTLNLNVFKKTEEMLFWQIPLSHISMKEKTKQNKTPQSTHKRAKSPYYIIGRTVKLWPG
jgi:hypothetical protein